MSVQGDQQETLSALEIQDLLTPKVTAAKLQYWDERGYFCPSYYMGQNGELLSQVDREASVRSRGAKSRADPPRAYTYDDLTDMRIFIWLRESLVAGGARRSLDRARDALDRLRELRREHGRAGRLVGIGRAVYYVGEGGPAWCLTGGGDIEVPQYVVAESDAEARGMFLASLARRGHRTQGGRRAN